MVYSLLLRSGKQMIEAETGFFNWNQAWNDEMILTGRCRLNDGIFWNTKAAENARASFTSELTEKQLALTAPSAEKSILEIGPGTGRLTIPLAQRSRRVTAVDPSAVMLGHLKKRAAEEGVENLIYLNSAWEDLHAEMLPETPDIILASYSLFMTDMACQLKRMNDIAGEKVILFVPGEPRASSGVRKILYGTEAAAGRSDHVILFNLLHSLGIDANVEIITSHCRKEFDCAESAARDLAEFHSAPEHKMPGLIQYVRGRLKIENGKYIFKQKRKTAALWWLTP